MKVRKGLFETLDILVVADDGVVFELLLLIKLFLVVVAVPKVVIGANVGQDGVGECGKALGVLVVDGQLHKVVLEMIVLQSDELLRRELSLDVLQQIGNVVDIDKRLSAIARLVGREETYL